MLCAQSTIFIREGCFWVRGVLVFRALSQVERLTNREPWPCGAGARLSHAFPGRDFLMVALLSASGTAFGVRVRSDAGGNSARKEVRCGIASAHSKKRSTPMRELGRDVAGRASDHAVRGQGAGVPSSRRSKRASGRGRGRGARARGGLINWGQRLAIGGQRLAEGPSRENALRARAEGLQYPWKDGDKEAFRRSFVGPSAYGPSEGLQGLQFESMVHP